MLRKIERAIVQRKVRKEVRKSLVRELTKRKEGWEKKFGRRKMRQRKKVRN